MKKKNPEPVTQREWQLAVDAAKACLALDGARQFGLLSGGPKVNVDRCVEILERGSARGVLPDAAGVDAIVAAFARGDRV